MGGELTNTGFSFAKYKICYDELTYMEYNFIRKTDLSSNKEWMNTYDKKNYNISNSANIRKKV